MSKHKRDEFREHKSPRTLEPDKQKILEEAEAVADEWCVPMRLRHVLDKMKVDGKDPGIEKMGDIIKNMIDDIYLEAKGEIVESREVAKAIGTLTVKLFKQHLIDAMKGE